VDFDRVPVVNRLGVQFEIINVLRYLWSGYWAVSIKHISRDRYPTSTIDFHMNTTIVENSGQGSERKTNC
jgi:hypothetical protein